eukprot:NODE_10540_length_283_cov_89.696581_g8772_i0.p2 GENE.NODE_10540_length_283_cov_89.696581_g8772_i0~~NODE_10540_length_283_cov_89.696581_g8772_i0.p2  ORF type:complete len:55 (+),score=12.28 NODE_10540_length_283_cov_89.696581_g8772_i0:115-279(+)
MCVDGQGEIVCRRRPISIADRRRRARIQLTTHAHAGGGQHTVPVRPATPPCTLR